MALRAFPCPRCEALRSVEDWHERGPAVLAVVLGPCGHVVERRATLEWGRANARRRTGRPALDPAGPSSTRGYPLRAATTPPGPRGGAA